MKSFVFLLISLTMSKDVGMKACGKWQCKTGVAACGEWQSSPLSTGSVREMAMENPSEWKSAGNGNLVPLSSGSVRGMAI